MEKNSKKAGYTIVEKRNTGNGNLYLLHIEEHVVHSPKSLCNQCNNLAQLAIDNEIEIFDGWDVEKTIEQGVVYLLVMSHKILSPT